MAHAALLTLALVAIFFAHSSIEAFNRQYAGKNVLGEGPGYVTKCRRPVRKAYWAAYREANAALYNATKAIAEVEGPLWEGAPELEPNITLPLRENPDRAYLAFVLIVKDEHRSRVREWIQYHHSVGVGRFYIYDDMSHPPLESYVADYIESGLVVYRYLDRFIGFYGADGQPGEMQQMAAYRDCIYTHGRKHTWLAPIDVDEFMMIRDCSSDLPSILWRYEAYGGLAVNWRLFGSGSNLFRPEGGLLESFISCVNWYNAANAHVKVFLNTQHVTNVTNNPHHYIYKRGYYAVNSRFKIVDSPFSYPPVFETLTLSHYVIRSFEEFQNKMAKGSGAGAKHAKNKDFWLDVEATSGETCHYGLVEGKRLREERERLLSILPGGVEGEEEEEELEEEAEEEEGLLGGALSTLLGGWWLGGGSKGCGSVFEDKDGWKAGWATPAGANASATGSGGAGAADGRQAGDKEGGSVSLMCRKRHKEPAPDPMALRAWALNFTVVPPAQGSEYLALCTVTRDDPLDRVREWIAYHRDVGVGHIYLYDDASTVPLAEGLRDYIGSGMVVLRHFPGGEEKWRSHDHQLAAFKDCLDSYAPKHKWIGFIDVDEFAMIHDRSPNLPAVLARYEGYGGLAVNWRMFGSAKHAFRPGGMVLGTFRACTSTDFAPNVKVKAFVNTAAVANVSESPHYFHYKPGYHAVNANFTRVEGGLSFPPVWEIVSLSHYGLQSFQEYKQRMGRLHVEPGKAAALEEQRRQRKYWQSVEKAATTTCYYGLPHGKRVKKEAQHGPPVGEGAAQEGASSAGSAEAGSGGAAGATPS